MGWPEETETLRTLYPTSVMETGHDIIFFWVARMMMMGLHFMGEVPFRTVYLHPMVRDEKGQKMSKTRGNVIDPLDITEKYGADALRFTLAALTAQGRDIKLAKERIEGYRAFANKLWNATRFALMNLDGYQADGEGAPAATSPADRWILARLQRAVNGTVEALEGYHFNEAASTVYQFVWHELCDWYIELSKEALYGEDAARKRGCQAVLVHCLETSFRLLHPMMPFITEELWQTLRGQVKAGGPASILLARYPEKGAVDEGAERRFGPVIGVVEAIRNVRGEMNVPFKTALPGVQVGSLSPEALATVREEIPRIERLANAQGLELGTGPTRRVARSAVAVGTGYEVRVPLSGVVDMAAELSRIDKELQKGEAELTGVEKKLENQSFVERAPAEVVEKERARLVELRGRQEKLRAHRDMLTEPEAPPPQASTSTSKPAARKKRAGPKPTARKGAKAARKPAGKLGAKKPARKPAKKVAKKPARKKTPARRTRR
jgi:valyl-tRNA synthetase